MKILLIGYGKVGRAVEQVALQQGHVLAHIIDTHTQHVLSTLDATSADVAIEFTQAEAAYHNIYQCLSAGIPVVSGTTGWLHNQQAIEAYCRSKQGAFFYAANFSLGAHIFFRLNQMLARLMQPYPEYCVHIDETHHATKRDKPSQTAIALAEDIIHAIPEKLHWVQTDQAHTDGVGISSQRTSQVVGIHAVTYTAAADTLTIQHTAHDRLAFAKGAVLAAEWLQGKQGIFTMQDLLPWAC
ncbi:MAG: 4-hydroxy-tetrahydrodipicolinate reductase [Bacteroidota bacterium]